MNDAIGALWEKESKKGTRYLSGKVKVGGQEVEIVVFENDKGDNSKRPDYRIFESEKRGDAPQKNFKDEVPF